MRRTYSLSTETIKVINGHATDVAEEFGCDPSYIHNILGGTHTDPFAKFEWLYASAVKAGCDVSHYDNRLDAIKAKHLAKRGLSVDAEMAKSIDEDGDALIARLQGKSLYEQLNEVCESITQKEILKAALIDAINDEREAENGARTRFAGQPVSVETRQKVRAKLRSVG